MQLIAVEPSVPSHRIVRQGLSDLTIRMVGKPVVFLVSLLPAAWLAWSALSHQLNVNPFNAIVRSTGYWSLRSCV